MSHLLQCTRGIWITKVGVSLRFLQLPIHLQQLEGIKSYIILGAWSALVSWPFIPPDTLYSSTSAGKFLPRPLLRAKREVLERGGGGTMTWRERYPFPLSPLPTQMLTEQTEMQLSRGRNHQNASSDHFRNLLLTRWFRTTHNKWQGAISP